MQSTEQQSTQWTINASQKLSSDPLLDSLVLITEHYGNPCSAEALSAGLPLTGANLTPELLPQAASRAGLSAKLVRKGLNELPSMLLPCILMLKDKKALVLQELNVEKNIATVSLPETGGEEQLTIEELESSFVGYLFLIKQQYRGDRNFDVHLNSSKEHWLWQKIKNTSSIYRDVIIASVMINIFALVSPLFVMNIYDKVIPNLAFESLWVLAIGAGIAYIFDLILKQLRGYLIDVAGKKIDIEVSSKLFAKVIGIPLEKRSPSVGGMAKQLSEFDSVREFLSSATISALVDLPFAVLFMFCIWLVAGDLVMFPIIASILIISYTLLNQSKLRKAIEESNKFSGLRHGHLIECLSALESIKANGAEGVVQRAWQQMVGHTSTWLLKSKMITNSVLNFASFIVQISVVAVVVLGVYRVSENLISMGGIIAAVMLTGRAISPIAKLAGLMTRSNQTLSALKQLDTLMEQEGEFEDKAHLVSRTKLSGNIHAENISFKYPNAESDSLLPMSVKIKQGERIAIVGHNGSGKTTLAKLLLGLYQPSKGSIQFDGLNHRQIHPSDLRKNIGYLPQDIVLFHGTIRDNILFGTRQVTEYQLIRAVQLSGVSAFTDHNSQGLDQQVGESGSALSRGQRQSIVLARAILNSPQILLLDEPTASLDARAEKKFIEAINATAKDRTMLLITHKMDLLKLVDRILVLDKGKLIIDGPKDKVLAQLKGEKLNQEASL
ncbi:type I secretion system permease/ATPase [Colwellia hornerae]|uniref:Type I secretion system permease/ATPase n=1 Tax=Colwellia hornerae TaxID=89402 RepID=A0A5C6Q8I1_9GAMM|nr:type I secretion system permease/ATPase [Colwellia hornerae]TWX52196.1 type I secretion system permease/ATPase [Colwellia hornerae]TWX57545.1 type I secretion system permease/ATPase [Colwellia hornerae]TWX64897.1 type I secretion system permease/ATPase [Colwellia hornerae]